MQAQMVGMPNVAIFLDIDGLLGSVSYSRMKNFRFDQINEMVRDILTGEEYHTYKCKRCTNCSLTQIHLFEAKALNSLEKLVRKIEEIAKVRIVISSTDQQKLAVHHLQCLFWKRGFSNVIFKIEDDLLASRIENTIKNYMTECADSDEKPSEEGYETYCKTHGEKNWPTQASKINKWISDHSEYVGFLIFDDVDGGLKENFRRKLISIHNHLVGNLNDLGEEFCKSINV